MGDFNIDITINASEVIEDFISKLNNKSRSILIKSLAKRNLNLDELIGVVDAKIIETGNSFQLLLDEVEDDDIIKYLNKKGYNVTKK